MSAPSGDWLQRAQFRLMQLLPSEWSSALGSLAVRLNVRFNRPEILAGARANLKRHFPQASEAEITRMIAAFLDGVGRMMSEFAILHRFIPEGRFETEGLDAFKAIAGTRPIIALGLHTGNWETFGPMFQHAGIPLASFYMPPENAFERQIAEATRARFGVSLLSPDAAGLRQAIRLLRAHQIVMILPDEARDGHVLGPLFGRKPHLKGNLAIATRLARQCGAQFVICHSRRIAPCRFRLTFAPALDLPAADPPDPLADVAFLNAAIEPIIRDNLPRWYFLDDSLDPVE